VLALRQQAALFSVILPNLSMYVCPQIFAAANRYSDLYIAYG